MNFLHCEDIFKFSKAKSERDNECQCTCDECGDECNPFYKVKEQKNER